MVPWFEALVKFGETLLMVTDERRTGVRQWRFIVALCILGFALHIVWACGWLGVFGIEGFAQVKELKTIQGKLDTAAADSIRIQEQLLAKSIVDVRIQQCNAMAKRFYTDHLHELTDQYFDLTHRPFDVPTCQELD